MNYTIPQEDVLGKKRKLTFSGHETFPFRYTWLKKAVDAVNDDSSIFTQESALSTLGVGKNMVNSIRHWGKLTEMIEAKNGKNIQNWRSTSYFSYDLWK